MVKFSNFGGHLVIWWFLPEVDKHNLCIRKYSNRYYSLNIHCESQSCSEISGHEKQSLVLMKNESASQLGGK
jgi:hypothetical protein